MFGTVISQTSRTPITVIVRSFILHNFLKFSKQLYRTVPTGKLPHYTATLPDLHNYNLMINLYQIRQSNPAALQLRRRFKTVRCASASKSLTRWNLHWHSGIFRLLNTAAWVVIVTPAIRTRTWRQILYELEVARATMEWQVHIWITNSKFGWKLEYKD